jgi:ABC-type Zn uptake system ZnuABC Zn-binding protein ZnuA
VCGGIGVRVPAGRLAALLAAAMLLAACGRVGVTPTPSGPPADADAIHVVTTTTILADLVRQVGGTRVVVTSLVPKGGEVHTFDPRPSSMRAVASAELVVRNGLGLDDWLAGLITNTGSTAPSVAAAEDLPGVTYLRAADGAVNPHVWMNPRYASAMAAKIAAELVAVDPGHKDRYAAGLATFQGSVAALDLEASAAMAAIPQANRTVVAFHDAFPYFASAYGLVVDGTIVAAPGQDPSAGTVAHLVARIRTDGIRAIFAEAQFNDELAQTLARETGAAVVTDLYTDSTGDAPRDTYEGVMRWNVERVTAALLKP